MKKTLIVIGCSMALLLSSCVVTKKKYDDLMARKVRVEGDKAACEEELDKRKAELRDLQAQINKMKDEKKVLDATYESLLNDKGKISKELVDQYKQLELAKLENEKLATELKAREERVKELEKILSDKDKAVNDLKNKISQALTSFQGQGLTVQVKNGKVYVSLAEKLLFKTGSTSVDPKGVEALKQLASALKEQADISVLVEGHTDDVPIAKGTSCMIDNWELSVMRATAITRILTSYGVAPTKITAAGRGEFFPVDPAKTPDARQKNRRTEIILTPKLDEIFQILNSN